MIESNLERQERKFLMIKYTSIGNKKFNVVTTMQILINKSKR